METKILIVDDDVILAEMLGRFLETFGYPQSGLSHDGGEALLFLEEHPEVCLIFTDLEMPNVDGRDFIRQYHEKGGTAKIILMSGTFTPEDSLAILAKEAHANAALPKPFLPHTVFDVLTFAGVSPKMFN